MASLQQQQIGGSNRVASLDVERTAPPSLHEDDQVL